MKKVLLITILLGIWTVSYAQKVTGKITMFSENGDKFWLVLNGVKINQKAEFRVTAENLTETRYQAKMIFQNNKIPALNEIIFVIDVDGNVYSKTLQIKTNKKGKYITRVVSAEILGNNNPTPPAVIPPKQEVINPVVNPKVDPDNTPKEVVVPVVPPKDVTPSPTPVNNNTTVNCGTAMSDADFNEAIALVKSSSFSSEKLSSARQVRDNNCLSLNQVKSLMSAFSFDDDKLEFSKYAYSKCTEPKKYYLLKTNFMSSFTKDAFDDFLNSKK